MIPYSVGHSTTGNASSVGAGGVAVTMADGDTEAGGTDAGGEADREEGAEDEGTCDEGADGAGELGNVITLEK